MERVLLMNRAFTRMSCHEKGPQADLKSCGERISRLDLATTLPRLYPRRVRPSAGLSRSAKSGPSCAVPARPNSESETKKEARATLDHRKVSRGNSCRRTQQRLPKNPSQASTITEHIRKL